MRREEGVRARLARVTNEPIIANLGPATADLFAAGDRDANLYTFGGMGLVSSIGLGVALAAPDRRVYVTDGDGSLLMNLGSLATIAAMRPGDLVLIVWDNPQRAGTGGAGPDGRGTSRSLPTPSASWLAGGRWPWPPVKATSLYDSTPTWRPRPVSCATTSPRISSAAKRSRAALARP